MRNILLLFIILSVNYNILARNIKLNFLDIKKDKIELDKFYKSCISYNEQLINTDSFSLIYEYVITEKELNKIENNLYKRSYINIVVEKKFFYTLTSFYPNKIQITHCYNPITMNNRVKPKLKVKLFHKNKYLFSFIDNNCNSFFKKKPYKNTNIYENDIDNYLYLIKENKIIFIAKIQSKKNSNLNTCFLAIDNQKKAFIVNKINNKYILQNINEYRTKN
jgi:hypothetical protein